MDRQKTSGFIVPPRFANPIGSPLPAPQLSDSSGHLILMRFRDNSIGFWDTHRWYIYAFLLALWCDALSTVHFMTHLGIDSELHPGVRLASVAFGPVAGPLVGATGKAVACFIVTIYCRRFARLIFLCATGIYLWAAWYNMWGITMDFGHGLPWPL